MTAWFRHPEVFPIITRHLGALKRPVTIWTAACATGQEAYSLAIMLERAGIPGRVLASDMEPAYVGEAQDALYEDAAVRGDYTGDPTLGQWLKRSGQWWTPVAAVRQRVTFSVDALGGGDNPPERCDVVFARNVWRHLDLRQQLRAAQDISAAVDHCGLLVIGRSDVAGLGGEDHRPLAVRMLFRQDDRSPMIWRAGSSDLTPR